VIRAWAASLVVVLALGCGKKATTDGPPAASGSAAPRASAAASGASAAASSAAPTKTAEWAVTYKTTAGTLYIPDAKDWASAKFKNDESKYLGEGTLSLAVDSAGVVTGSSEGGPLGATVIQGFVDKGVLSATVRRKTPSDDGLTGTIIARTSDDKLEGSMKLAEANAAVVRDGTITAKRK
jgi:hypothetical protein